MALRLISKFLTIMLCYSNNAIFLMDIHADIHNTVVEAYAHKHKVMPTD